MPLSTSHFKSQVPWQAVRLCLVALVVWAASAFYTLRLNPELDFYRHGHRIKQQWVKKLNQEYETKIIFCGGSSCASSINAEQMLQEEGLPSVNLGLAAGMGAKVVVAYGLQAARSGDLLVIALEPDLLCGEKLELEPVGVQFGLAIGCPDLLRDPVSVDWPAALTDLRPGSYHLCTLLGKLVLRQPLYRYAPAQWHQGGWQEIANGRKFHVAPVEGGIKISEDSKVWLRYIRDYCAAHRIRVTFVLPWTYCTPASTPALRSLYLDLLCEIADIIPALKDPSMGIQTDRHLFSDFALHLTPKGAALHTSELAHQLKTRRMWTREELTAAKLHEVSSR